MEKNQQTQTKFDAKATKSKIESLHQHYANLIQKKIRLDLEIKKIQQKARKLTTRTQKNVRERADETIRLVLESRHENPENPLTEEFTELSDLQELKQSLQSFETFLEVYQDLPLYED